MLTAQPGQRQGAERGDDVEVDEAAVAVPGTGPQVDPPGRQPDERQEAGHGQSGVTSAEVGLDRELAGERLGSATVEPGRVPASTFSSL
jgi:hypothetical protein